MKAIRVLPFVVCAFFSSSPRTNGATQPIAPRTAGVLADLPLRFEANVGQWDSPAYFVAQKGNVTLAVTGTGVTLGAPTANAAAVEFHLVGARPVVPRGEGELVTKSNYFLGRDPSKWRTNVPNYARVRAKDALAGVDMVWYEGPTGLEYDLEVAGGVDARELSLEVSGVDRLEIADDGSLRILTRDATFTQARPRVLQRGRGLEARYVIHDTNRITFAIDGYDPDEALLIDPPLTYSTYLGGSGYEQAVGIAADAEGSAYVTGYTRIGGFPTVNPYQATPGGGFDAFVSKLNPTGTALVYSTYIGGTGVDQAQGIAVDSAGNAYIAGFSQSADFPTANAYQGKPGTGINECFVTKLSASGSALVYSTYLGGSSDEVCWAIAVDGSGSAYVTGDTGSTDFPVANPLQDKLKGLDNVFVTKFSANGKSLAYSTFLGGSLVDKGKGIAVDASGSAYVVGTTLSTDFPLANPFQANHGGGTYDVFVTKLDPTGTKLSYSTYLGGSALDEGSGIAVDGAGSAYVTGATASTNFPVANAYRSTAATAVPFMTKLHPSGASLVYSTYLDGGENAGGIAVDAAGRATMVGWTSAQDIVPVDAFQSTLGGARDGFVQQLDSAGKTMLFSTYLGGSDIDYVSGVAVDANGAIYVAGGTQSPDFPTTNAYQTKSLGGDAVVAKRPGTGLPKGSPCGPTSTCGAGLQCVDGYCCNGPCDGQCQACDVPDHFGSCTPTNGKPHGSRAACSEIGSCAATCDGTDPLACHATSCPACIDDHRAKGTDGSITDCAPYKCVGAGQCTDSCKVSSDCVGNAVCSNGKCVPPAGDAGCSCDSGGSGGGLTGSILLFAAVALARGLARRRRGSTDTIE